MNKKKMTNLQTNFVNAFRDRPNFATKEVYDWYCLVRPRQTNFPHRYLVHTLILNPLLWQGILQRVSKGMYTFGRVGKADEWDEYVANKVKGG